MSLAILVAYVLGGLLGLLAVRSQAVGRIWPSFIRVNLLASAILLSIIAVWRLEGIDDLLWPFIMSMAFPVLLLVSWLTTARGPRRSGIAALQTWSATTNTGYFLVPIGAALAGPTGVVVAVLMDRFATPTFAYYVHLMRSTAPRPQRTRTTFVDQSPILALAVGLVLRATVPAPPWTATLSLWIAPIMAAIGAAMYIGSVLHPTQRIDPRPGLRRWIALSALRVLLFVPIVILAPTTTLKVIAVLSALTIPAFGAAQMSTIYGYADSSVAAANRFGWLVGALGLGAAILVAR